MQLAVGLLFLVTIFGVGQREGFVPVEGPNLTARLEAAARVGRGSYWSAYQFDVRPGVSVDVEWSGKRGQVNVGPGFTMSPDGKVETRNLGVFLLREAGAAAVTRVEIYNLDRAREYGGHPVYWLGRATNDESLSLLRGLVESSAARKVSESAVAAVALHDDARVGGMLEGFVRNSGVEKVRTSAVFWLGQIEGEGAFLADLVRNEQEALEVRKQAAFAIGVSKDKAALATLQGLYPEVKAREVKKQIIFAASVNESQDAAIDFLVRTAQGDADLEARKQALFWLGQKAGQKSLAALGQTVESNDADTEVQKQAVFAISQRPKDESIPLLIKIARTHSKAQVRQQAVFWLGQTGDERALAFFKEILEK